MLLILAMLFASSSWSCQTNHNSREAMPSDQPADSLQFHFPYQVNQPEEDWELPNSLLEISGLTMAFQDSVLLSVNDEEGVVFFLDAADGTVINEICFWKDGDYEGIEMVGNDAWVVKSTGTLYQIKNLVAAEEEVEKFNGFLEKDHNVEGLCYDADNQRLLLACKGDPGDEEKYPRAKAIYAFDLKQNALIDTPVFVIYLDDIHDFLETAEWVRKVEKLWEFFDPNESELGFKPSAIAIHPFTRNIYISSSVGKLLLVLSPEGQILHIEKLEKEIHRQPEGLAFDAQGNLYISNEGKKGTPKLYRFPYLKTKPGR